jgi:hypothetical protein
MTAGTSAIAERWPGMTQRRNTVTKTKAASTGWKAPNKRKSVAATKPEPAPTMIIAEEPAPALFWPYEVMRWWMPTARIFRECKTQLLEVVMRMIQTGGTVPFAIDRYTANHGA